MTRSLHDSVVTEHVFSDSCGNSFGGWWRDKTVQSYFTAKQSALSINTKELLAVYYTLCTFAKYLTNQCVLIHCDNSVNVSCLRKMNSSDPFRDRLTRRVFELADLHQFKVKATWISGRRNKRADALSRKMTLNPHTERSFPQALLDSILPYLDFTPDIDLFASHLNKKFPIFVAGPQTR